MFYFIEKINGLENLLKQLEEELQKNKTKAEFY